MLLKLLKDKTLLKLVYHRPQLLQTSSICMQSVGIAFEQEILLCRTADAGNSQTLVLLKACHAFTISLW